MAIHSHDKQSERNYSKTASVAKKKRKKITLHTTGTTADHQCSSTLELEMEEVGELLLYCGYLHYDTRGILTLTPQTLHFKMAAMTSSFLGSAVVAKAQPKVAAKKAVAPVASLDGLKKVRSGKKNTARRSEKQETPF